MRKSSPKKVSAKDMLLKDKEYLDTILQTKTVPDISFSTTNPLNPDNSQQTRYENPFIQKVRAVRKAKAKSEAKAQAGEKTGVDARASTKPEVKVEALLLKPNLNLSKTLIIILF